MKPKRVLTTAMLAGASLSLVACQSLDTSKEESKEGSDIETKNDEKTEKIEGNKVLSETEYADQVVKLSYDLVFGLEALGNSIPQEKIVTEEQSEKVIKQAQEIIPIIEKLRDLKAPDGYEAVQNQYKKGAEEVKTYLNGFIEEWNSLVMIDMDKITPHLENGITILAEAETELYKEYGKDLAIETNTVEPAISLESTQGKDTAKDEKKMEETSTSSNSSYSKEELKGTWEYYDEEKDIYTNVDFGDYGYASKYVGNPDGSSTTWAGSWYLDKNTIVMDVEEAYQGFDQNLSDFEKELRFEIVSKTDKKLVVNHNGEQITYEFLY